MFAAVPPEATMLNLRTAVMMNRAAMRAAIAFRADELVHAGAARQTRVAIAHDWPLSVLIDLFAAWRIGAVAVLLSPNLAMSEKSNVANRLQPAIWIGTDAPQAAAVLAPADIDAQQRGATDVTDPAGLDEPALILMTSGTTAQPKGVVHSRRSLLARIALNLAHIPAADLAVSLSLLPMHFGHGLIGNCLTPLFAGARLALLPNPGPANLATLAQTIELQRITFMSSVPSLWRVALKLSRPPSPSPLRRVHVGSAPLSAGLWQEIIAWTGTPHVVNMYGVTETANWIGGHDAAEAPPADGLVGRAWGGSLRLLDAQGGIAAGGRGEVAVLTPGAMSHYLDQPELTAATIGDGWFRTGDIGTFDAAGRLSIVGRIKHEINRGGIKIPAEEIDMLLEAHPDIAEACATSLPDPIAGELIGAAVVAKGGRDIEPEAIRQWCRSRIRSEAVPDRIAVVMSLPRNERGKADRRRVLAMLDGRFAPVVP